jgi:GH25 family lysozyme M1 (1,4-beta-N-acetylmuramidase)
MGKKDEDSKKPKKKGRASGIPFRYTLKSPAIYDFYEGEYPVDWEAIKATNPLRVVFQATYGRRGRRNNGKPDTAVKKYVEEAKANGVKYGLYHFLKPNFIEEQADFYWNTVMDLGGLGDMDPIVDIEYEPDRRDKNALRGVQWGVQIKNWLDIIENKSGGKRPIIYTSAKFWSFTLDRQGKPPEWTSQYPLWTAGYPPALEIDGHLTCPENYIPAGWKEYAIWQYAEDGRFRKHPANDLNLVSDSYRDILNKIGDELIA